MFKEDKFTIRVSAAEGIGRQELGRILAGWSEVVSFGRVEFSKTLPPREAIGFLLALKSSPVPYSLSISEIGRGSSEPSHHLLFGAGKGGESPRGGVKEAGVPEHEARARRASRGLALATLGVVLAASLVAGRLAKPRAEAHPAGISLGFYRDLFEDNRYGWVADGTAHVESGKYMISNRGGEKAVLVANERFSGRNVVAEVDVALLGGREDSFAGLAFRVRNPENFYFFGVSRDGSVALVKRELGFWRRLEPGGGVKHGAAGKSADSLHRLRVAAKDLYMEFWLDGELLSVVRDESFEEGAAGFYLGEDLDAAFDDLLLGFNDSNTLDAREPLEKKVSGIQLDH